MVQYACPICNKRACDSSKHLSLAKLSRSNENKADVIIKCQICKNILAVKVTEEPLTARQTLPHGKAIS